jgi:DNA repair exonuclease SbcCD ATPase subunit
MKEQLAEMRSRIDRKIGSREALLNEHSKAMEALNSASTLYDNLLQARAVVQNVAETTQKRIEYHISNLVTMAMESVFPDPYLFNLRFVQRRNKTEADLVFIKSENETDDILNAGGGGPADIAAFALRIALWSIKKSRAFQLLDEPMRFVSRNLQPKVSALMKELSSKLDMQFVVVSHIPELCEQADKGISIVNIDGASEVKLQEEE